MDAWPPAEKCDHYIVFHRRKKVFVFQPENTGAPRCALVDLAILAVDELPEISEVGWIEINLDGGLLLSVGGVFVFLQPEIGLLADLHRRVGGKAIAAFKDHERIAFVLDHMIQNRAVAVEEELETHRREVRGRQSEGGADKFDRIAVAKLGRVHSDEVCQNPGGPQRGDPARIENLTMEIEVGMAVEQRKKKVRS